MSLFVLQRLGCVQGEDLQYVFGVPLVFSGSDFTRGDQTEEGEYPKLGFFTGNYTRNEVQLSQIVMGYWANFIMTG